MTRVEKARTILSDWRFWVGVAYFGIALTVVGLFLLFNRTTKEEAFRAAGVRAAATTQVGQCFTTFQNGPITKGFIESFRTIIENSIIANRQAIQAQPQGPLTEVRMESLTRLERAKRNADALNTLILENIPTKIKCISLAHKLGIDPSRYIKKR